MKYVYKTVALIFLAILFSIASYSMTTHASGGPGFPPQQQPPPIVQVPPSHPSRLQHTIWLQVTDSCRQALPGGTLTVDGNGLHETIGPTSGGAKTQAISNSTKQCPVRNGSCVNNAEGCISVSLATGATYAITVARTPPGHNANVRYAVCEGGSVCPRGPQVATVHIAPGGTVSATTLNYYPDSTSVTYGPFTGTISNPVMFHLFGISKASGPANQCDGDHDADDYLTGTPGSHCDSDKDKK